MSAPPDPPRPDRRAQRRAATRGRLLAAARELFAQQGIDATRINEITGAAGVGFGSFYNHFESKDAIAAAVVETAVRELGEAIDAATADVEDVAEVVAIAHREIVRQAVADPGFGRLLVQLEASHDLVSRALGTYAARDLRRGLESGRFAVDDTGVALIAAGGALLGVVRGLLRGRTPGDPGTDHAAGVLRLFGVPGDEAAEVAARPLPALAP